MGRILLGVTILLLGLLYLGAMSLAVFGSGDPLNGTHGLSLESVVNGLLLLPVGVVAVAAGLHVLRRGRD